MFAGPQMITAKLVHRNKRTEMLDAQNEDKITQGLVNTTVLQPRSKAAIVVETRAEKDERKALAQERRRERLLEQQKIAQHMEDLMEKVLRETPLTKIDEDNLRNKMKTIIGKVNQASDKIDSAERLRQSNTISKPENQGAFLLWHEKGLH